MTVTCPFPGCGAVVEVESTAACGPWRVGLLVFRQQPALRWLPSWPVLADGGGRAWRPICPRLPSLCRASDVLAAPGEIFDNLARFDHKTLDWRNWLITIERHGFPNTVFASEGMRGEKAQQPPALLPDRETFPAGGLMLCRYAGFSIPCDVLFPDGSGQVGYLRGEPILAVDVIFCQMAGYACGGENRW